MYCYIKKSSSSVHYGQNQQFITKYADSVGDTQTKGVTGVEIIQICFLLVFFLCHLHHHNLYLEIENRKYSCWLIVFMLNKMDTTNIWKWNYNNKSLMGFHTLFKLINILQTWQTTIFKVSTVFWWNALFQQN